MMNIYIYIDNINKFWNNQNWCLQIRQNLVVFDLVKFGRAGIPYSHVMETETISRYESWKIWLKVWQRKKNLVFVFVRRQIYLLTKMKTRDFCSVKLWYAMLSILQTLLWVKTTIIKMCFGYWNFDLLLELTVLFSLHLSSNFIVWI